MATLQKVECVVAPVEFAELHADELALRAPFFNGEVEGGAL